MKKAIVLVLILNTISSFSQRNDEDIFFKLRGDTIMFYLDNVADITVKSNAYFHRTVCIDEQDFEYTGKVVDTFIDNGRAYECFYSKGHLSGEVRCFNPDGNLRYDGFFKNSLKDSVWTFYYENGNVEKIINFNNNEPYLKEFYKSNGKGVFVDGNGKYTGRINYVYKQTSECRISGNIKNGKMDGSWRWKELSSGGGIDYFENGKYIKSESYGLDPFDSQKISLLGYDLHEKVEVFKFMAVPSSRGKNHIVSRSLKYKNTFNLNESFATELVSFLTEINKKESLPDYWTFVQFKVNCKNDTENIIVHSNNKLASHSIKKFISELNGFEAAKPNNNPLDCAIYLCLFHENGKIILPKYNFNSKFDIMDLLPNN